LDCHSGNEEYTTPNIGAEGFAALQANCPLSCGVCDPNCTDTEGWLDGDGYSCADWAQDYNNDGILDCHSGNEEYTTPNIGAEGVAALQANCPKSCGVCGAKMEPKPKPAFTGKDKCIKKGKKSRAVRQQPRDRGALRR